MINRADYDIDQSIPPELLGALKEHDRKAGGEMINRSKRTDFERWSDLQLFRLLRHQQNKRPIQLQNELIEAAREYLPYPIVGNRKRGFLGDAPFGRYDWIFCVEMEQERAWNFPEFQEGYAFGLAQQIPYRNANPYRKEPSRERSWDRGYILGHHERN